MKEFVDFNSRNSVKSQCMGKYSIINTINKKVVGHITTCLQSKVWGWALRWTGGVYIDISSTWGMGISKRVGPLTARYSIYPQYCPIKINFNLDIVCDIALVSLNHYSCLSTRDFIFLKVWQKCLFPAVRYHVTSMCNSVMSLFLIVKKLSEFAAVFCTQWDGTTNIIHILISLFHYLYSWHLLGHWHKIDIFKMGGDPSQM